MDSDREINRLVQEIGLSLDRLRQLVPLDEIDIEDGSGTMAVPAKRLKKERS
jgi:hypothetical protein